MARPFQFRLRTLFWLAVLCVVGPWVALELRYPHELFFVTIGLITIYIFLHNDR
ncbi:MAG: hypothetical protein WD278_17730 [Pirellulales bacterium]